MSSMLVVFRQGQHASDLGAGKLLLIFSHLLIWTDRFLSEIGLSRAQTIDKGIRYLSLSEVLAGEMLESASSSMTE